MSKKLLVLLLATVLVCSGLLISSTPLGALERQPKPAGAYFPQSLDKENNLNGAEDLEKICKLFISRCFSDNSNLEDLGLVDEESKDFLTYLKNRKELIYLRREAFDNFKTMKSFTLQIEDVDVREDCAIALAYTVENFVYDNEPSRSAVAATRYLLVLRNTSEGWKIYWATSDDSYSKSMEKPANYGTIGNLKLPFVHSVNSAKDLAGHQSTSYPSSAIFDACRAFPYHDFEQLKQQEVGNIERELDQLSSKETRATGNRPKELEGGDFDRFEMRNYQNVWALSRNLSMWGDFTGYGGDCQNYASQVIKAGGAPFDESGSYQWYYYGYENRAPAWTSVRWMRDYIGNNTGLGPNGQFVSSPASLLTGDIVHIDWTSDGLFDHAVVIYNPGSSPTVSGHTEDCLDKRLSCYPGTKAYIHLTHYGN